MASRAQGDEVFLGVISSLATELLVVNLQI
jgi:hypothetical protein